jgi:hypothetical protein
MREGYIITPRHWRYSAKYNCWETINDEQNGGEVKCPNCGDRLLYDIGFFNPSNFHYSEGKIWQDKHHCGVILRMYSE